MISVNEWDKTKELWEFVISNYGDTFDFKELTSENLSLDFKIKYGERFIYEPFLNYEVEILANHFVTSNFDTWTDLFKMDLNSLDPIKSDLTVNKEVGSVSGENSSEQNSNNKTLQKDLMDFSKNNTERGQSTNEVKENNTSENTTERENYSLDMNKIKTNMDYKKRLSLIHSLNNDLENFLLLSSY